MAQNIPLIFSAGFDVKELYQPNPERFKEFYNAVQNVWLSLYGAKIPTIALINGIFSSQNNWILIIITATLCLFIDKGYCPGGGCILALATDYRIMVMNEKFKIGLNESRLGIVVPFWYDIKEQNESFSKFIIDLS